MREITQYTSPPDSSGSCRKYVLFEHDEKFVFNFEEWSAVNDKGLSIGIRKQYLEFASENEARKEYENYLSVWEGIKQ